MKRLHLTFLAALLPLLAGCGIERGYLVDFANPIFDAHFGNCATLMCFPDSTVLQIGGTYCTLNMPFYLLVIISALVVLMVRWFAGSFCSTKS